MSFFPIDREILTSSIWTDASPAAFKVWFYLLISADPRNGIVRATVPAIAQHNGLTVNEIEIILTWLEGADPYSRTPDNDGRRIERTPDGIQLVTYIKHRDRDHSTARVQKFRARKKARETERNTVSPFHETVETTDTDTDTDTEKETKNSSNSPKPEPEKAELRSDSDSSKDEHVNLTSSSPPRKKNGAEDTARRYVAVLDAVSGRRTRKLSPDVVMAVKQRLKDWAPWQIVGVPILVFAQGRRDKYSPDVFLRDGTHPRTRDGNTYGGFYWLSRTYESADGTRLDARLTSVAEQAGVLERFHSIGVITGFAHTVRKSQKGLQG